MIIAGGLAAGLLATACCKQVSLESTAAEGFEIEFSDAAGHIYAGTKGSPVEEVRLGINNKPVTELKANLYRNNVEYQDASLSWSWQNTSPSIVSGAQNSSQTTSLTAVLAGKATIKAIASLEGYGEVARKEIPVIVSPFTMNATVQQMEDIYVSNVQNLGSGGLTPETILSTSWQSFNTVWDVHDFNAFGLAQVLEDLDWSFGVEVFKEYYENGYASYSACSTYLGWNGHQIIEMFRQRIISRYGSI